MLRYVHTCTYTHVYIHAHIHMYMHTYMHTYTHTSYIHTHTYIHAHIHTYIHITYTHTYVHKYSVHAKHTTKIRSIMKCGSHSTIWSDNIHHSLLYEVHFWTKTPLTNYIITWKENFKAQSCNNWVYKSLFSIFKKWYYFD